MLRNPLLIKDEGEWGTGTFGPDPIGCPFNGKMVIASQNGLTLAANTTYRLSTVGRSTGSVKARIGDSAFVSIPAGEGLQTVDITTGNEPGDGFMIRDPNEQESGLFTFIDFDEVA